MRKYKYLIEDDSKVICHCGDIKKYQIKRMHRGGIKSLEQMSLLIPICTGCRGCRSDIEELIQDLDKSLWQKITEVICFWRKM